ncbi:MAG TPA: zf-HC2 domain-containing protein [Bacteroidetes bacterium]|nr:zf-HC2 domain-containing protein [Bacteroidota bacterium]
MNCKKTNTNFIDAIEKTLSNDEQKAFEQHIASCQTCSKSFQKVKEVYQSINAEVEEYAPNPLLAQKIWDRLSSKQNAESTIIPFTSRAVGSLAAAGIALGIVIGTLLNTSSATVSPNDEQWTQLAEDYFPSDMFSPYDELQHND